MWFDVPFLSIVLMAESANIAGIRGNERSWLNGVLLPDYRQCGDHFRCTVTDQSWMALSMLPWLRWDPAHIEFWNTLRHVLMICMASWNIFLMNILEPFILVDQLGLARSPQPFQSDKQESQSQLSLPSLHHVPAHGSAILARLRRPILPAAS